MSRAAWLAWSIAALCVAMFLADVAMYLATLPVKSPSRPVPSGALGVVGRGYAGPSGDAVEDGIHRFEPAPHPRTR